MLSMARKAASMGPSPRQTPSRICPSFFRRIWAVAEMVLPELIKNATEARDRLLPKLMSGEIDLSDGKQAEILQFPQKLSYDEFLSELGMAARAKSISDADLRAMYEAYLDDDATE